jgi:mycothiol synthase
MTSMKRRTYQGDLDLKLLQDFNAAAIAETDGCGYLHPGDIPHRLFNGNKYFDPAEVMTIWEDESGVAAWVLVGPRHKSYDAQLRPDLRGGDFELAVLVYADSRTVELMRQHNIETDRFYADAYQCDTARSRLLLELGWEPGEQSTYVLTRTTLENIAEPVLPEGYTIRAVRGTEDAAAVASVHLASFPGAGWTPTLYRQVMESPGYAPEREFVIVAPDGTFVAFTLTWHDELNKTGYFEPVGTHKDYRRRGLGRAIVLYGMQQMVAAGMKFATVAHFSNNSAAGELYKACGFKIWHRMDDYSKPVSS